MLAISLFDYTGNMLKPWADAGYECIAFDLQHSGVKDEEGITKVQWDALSRPDVQAATHQAQRASFIAAFPPCDHLAVSGSRWMKGKGLRALSESIEMFAVAAEVCEASEAPYMIENPVSTISTYWRKPDYTFHPWQYSAFELGDNYTKKTCLWTGGGFVMPQFCHPADIEPDDRIHKAAPGADRKNFRSATPMGFARAVFQSNKGITCNAA